MAVPTPVKTEGKRIIAKPQTGKLVWVPGEHPELNVFQDSPYYTYISYDWSPRLLRMNDTTAALVWCNPEMDTDAPVNFRMFARTVSLDATMTLGPVRKLMETDYPYSYSFYGLAWGPDSTGDNFVLAWIDDGGDYLVNIDGKRMHCILMSQDLEPIHTQTVQMPDYDEGNNDSMYLLTDVRDGVWWTARFYQGEVGADRYGLIKFYESGGTFARTGTMLQGQMGFRGPSELGWHGNRLMWPDGNNDEWYTCTTDDPAGTVQEVSPIGTSLPGWTSSAFATSGGAEANGQTWSVPHPTDPDRIYIHGTIYDDVRFPGGDAWPAVMELLWTGSGYEVVKYAQLANIEPFYEEQQQVNDDDVRFWGFIIYDSGAYAAFMYAHQYNGPGWPLHLKYNENNELFLGQNIYQRQPGPPFYGQETSIVWNVFKSPQDVYEFNYTNENEAGGKNAFSNRWGEVEPPEHIAETYPHILSNPNLYVYENFADLDFIPTANGVLMMQTYWIDAPTGSHPEVTDVAFPMMVWLTPSIPPLRHMQRDDTLSKRSGNARLNTRGVGRATSLQESRAPRLSAKQYF